jgi:DNA-binding GntR family transcriptional regulator
MLSRIYETLRMQTRLMRNLLHGSLGSERDSRREHLEIVAALQARDPVASRSAMERHLVRSRHAILRNLFGEGTP